MTCRQPPTRADDRCRGPRSPAEAVEGGDPGLPVVVLQPFIDAPSDLGGRPGRKRERQDLVAPGDVFEHGLLVQVDQRARLPGARPRENSERPLDVVDVEWQSVYLWLVGRIDYAGARVLSSAPGVNAPS